MLRAGKTVIAMHRCLLWVALVVPAAGSADLPPKIPVRALFANATLSSPEISDDGQTIAYVQSFGDVQVILSKPVMGGQPTALAKFDNPETRLTWIEWANGNRLLISGQARNIMSIGMRSRVTRLFGIDRDGKNFTWLGKRWPTFGQMQMPVTYQDNIIHMTPKDPQYVLMEISPPDTGMPKVMRMDVDSGMLKLEQAAMKDIQDWYADRDGIVRAGVATPENHYELWARVGADDRFELVLRHKIFDEDGPKFAGFHADPGKIYVTQTNEGRAALFEFDLATRTVGKLAFAHPDVDVGGIQRDAGPEQRAVGARFIVDRPEIYFFDHDAELEHRALRNALQVDFNTPIFHRPVSISADGSRQILEVTSDVQPPVYYFYDRQKRQIDRIFEQRPEIDTKALAPTKRMTYRARDGLEIPCYLTLPLGVEPKKLPVIALIHGGPWSRDWIDWDPEVQLFANRGFAVLQMNFRGSSGYGRKHLESGYREWGEKIQDDITDGVKWLIAQGIADPDRIGIAGASYGGYATLVGLVKTPELYRAGAAYASVTDIEFLLNDDKWYDWGYEWHETMVGGNRGDTSRLRQSSPLRRVAEIRAPVLLGHGEDDQRVHVRQSRRMAEALRHAGKQYEYMEFPDEIHGFVLEANRVKWYEREIAFFEENLAPRLQPVSN
jgi:dipeptidyl aminopeptidase/acylaminoacyl peptidase